MGAGEPCQDWFDARPLALAPQVYKLSDRSISGCQRFMRRVQFRPAANSVNGRWVHDSIMPRAPADVMDSPLPELDGGAAGKRKRMRTLFQE